jgi:hypothetical protein
MTNVNVSNDQQWVRRNLRISSENEDLRLEIVTASHSLQNEPKNVW